ncbi:BamA/TamA family outer membrane protein [uncultured Mesonia sp.]|uniref:translocation and assembly module lipoprotein TamL n=1 Tax=uncultured Mesonia sp. TaxID=399731 RepID=UPI00374EE925
MTKIKFSCLAFLGWMCLALILQACSVKKFIPQGKTLYTGADIKLNDTLYASFKQDENLKNALNAVLYPEPNSKFLGGYPNLFFYYKGQKENPGFIYKFLAKKRGEEPVYFEDENVNQTVELIKNRLENHGYYYYTVNSKVDQDTTAKTTSVNYQIAAKRPYTIADYLVEEDSIHPAQLYKDIKSSLQNSLIKKGMRFNLQQFKAERERIDKFLKEKGYYNFNSDFLIFEADTNRYDKQRFDLFLSLKNNIPRRSKHPYVLDSVLVFPNESIEKEKRKLLPEVFNNIHYYQDTLFFKPKRLAPFIQIKPGETYSPDKSKSTSRRLASTGVYKFVNIVYKEKDTVLNENNQYELVAEIRLSPYKKRAIRANLQTVTKSNSFAGPGIGLDYINKNWLKGGEVLKTGSTFSYERQFGGQQKGLQSLQLGLESQVSFPRLLFPFDINHRFKYSTPKTNIRVGYDYLNRSNLYSLNSISASFGYSWQANKYVTHSLNLLKLDYVRLGKTTSEFEAILDENPFLRESFEQQFILGLTYSFTYNELLSENKNSGIYFNLNFDTAGNSLGIFGKQEKGEEVKKFLGLAYAQYAKTDIDVSYHLNLNKNQFLVGRVFAGLGIPYGNSNTLPFVKQFFSGGPYSVRAFNIRSLGPGTYESNDEGGFFDQSGDIRLEANLEYRFPLFNYVNGAIFVDAGNVWLMNENEKLPGGKFTNDFINEFGVGSGVGVRVDIQGFVLRFDLAAPLKKPAQNWKFNYSKPVFNFAIGYPF